MHWIGKLEPKELILNSEIIMELIIQPIFLPEMAGDEGWDQRTTLKYLIKNAGYKGSLDKII